MIRWRYERTRWRAVARVALECAHGEHTTICAYRGSDASAVGPWRGHRLRPQTGVCSTVLPQAEVFAGFIMAPAKNGQTSCATMQEQRHGAISTLVRQYAWVSEPGAWCSHGTALGWERCKLGPFP